MLKSLYNSKIKLLAAIFLLPGMAYAATNTAETQSLLSNALFNTLLIIIIVLAIMVLTLSRALKNIVGSDFFLEKLKKSKAGKKDPAANSGLLLLFFSLAALSGFGQNTAQPVITPSDNIGGLQLHTFYTMLGIIACEFIALAILFNIFKNALADPEAKQKAAPAKVKTRSLLDRINATVEIEKEGEIVLDHEYDGIRELDNDLPPWWKYGFYLTVVVAVVYMINYHVAHTSPLQAEEYHNSLKKAEKEIAEYMKTSANNVDESTVKLLTEASDIKTGKDLFIANCAACHGQSGEGTVGPNLTDDYWLHGGSIQDVFKTIKYGWPDKGMKSWKEDFSPMQIAQLTSFLRTFKGTNPSKPKEKQGELYLEKAAETNTTPAPTDSSKVLNAALAQ